MTRFLAEFLLFLSAILATAVSGHYVDDWLSKAVPWSVP